MFDDVSPRIDFPAVERQVLDFWEKESIYEKSLANRRGAPTFVFFEGPPTANGLPHPGHCLTRVIKDVFPRYATMRGYRCERKAGWDTHGLPVEVEVCKEIGISSKQEIEAYGIEPFIHRCMESVFRYTREWEDLTKRLGFWVNLEDAYVTYHKSFVESVWWALKTLFDKGLLYQGHKVVWWWAQGGTALSSGEVGEGYRETDDPSIYVRFRLRKPAALGLEENIPTSFLAWTTTPWTLSSNIALAVREEYDYAVVELPAESGVERLIVAEGLFDKTFHGIKFAADAEPKVVRRLTGSQLLGTAYEPIFNYMPPQTWPNRQRQWEVDAADFVTLDAGTGIVHIAPAFGEDDYRFAADRGFGFLQMVQPDGTFRPEAVDVAGMFCKDADKEIIRILKDRGVLFKRETYRHPYPFCPRAENDPLIQYARKSWFIRTTDFKEEFLANNAEINWLPEHIREGRFGDFLRNNVDWAISRERYWGTPLPIWECETTGFQEAIGSYAELLAKPGLDGTQAWENAKRANPSLSDHLCVHKPYIDSVTYQSPKDPKSRMRRVTEVIDCWFDSGAMPFAQWGFPHQNQDRFADQFPASFISEALDQTRGWFYSLVSIATMLRGELGKVAAKYPLPFKTCIVLGLILGEDGQKMSKRKKNYREPTYIFDAYGADAMRWYFCACQPPWSTIRFQESAIQESQREFLIRLHNVYSFFVIYANIDRFDPRSTPRPAEGDRSLLDRWILSELNSTVGTAIERMDAFDSFAAAQRLTEFVDALSNWYVRRSRERFWASGFSTDKQAAYWTLYECLTTLSKAMAPFVPFYAEAMHQNLVRRVDGGAAESVHICDYPQPNADLIDGALSAEMSLVREIVSVGRAARTKSKLKVRQPLRAAEVLLADHRLDDVVVRYQNLIADELNVKIVEAIVNADAYVSFAVKPNLKSLGPRFGKKLNAVSKALSAADAAMLRQSLIDSGSATVEVDGEEIPFGIDDVMIDIAARPGFAAADGKRAVVVLTTEVTPELKAEGLCREVVHAIQTLRKNAGLAFDDRIRLGIQAEGEIADAIALHSAYIQAETLAVELVAADAIQQPLIAEEQTLEGHKVALALAKA